MNSFNLDGVESGHTQTAGDILKSEVSAAHLCKGFALRTDAFDVVRGAGAEPATGTLGLWYSVGRQPTAACVAQCMRSDFVPAKMELISVSSLGTAVVPISLMTYRGRKSSASSSGGHSPPRTGPPASPIAPGGTGIGFAQR